MFDRVVLDARNGICLDESVLLDVDLVSTNLTSKSLLGLLGLEILHGSLGHEEILAERDVGSSQNLVVDPLDIVQIDIGSHTRRGRVSMEKLVGCACLVN